MKDTADSGGRSRDGAARDEQNTPELPPVKHTKLTDVSLYTFIKYRTTVAHFASE